MKRITFTKAFKKYKGHYGVKAGIQFLEGYYGIKYGQYGAFEKQARTALKAEKKRFTFHPPKRKRK